MKRIYSLILLLTTGIAHACPTCYGALVDHSPPFFSEEAYQPATAPAPTQPAEERHEQQKNVAPEQPVAQ